MNQIVFLFLILVLAIGLPLFFKMSNSLSENKPLQILWNKQEGKCLNCKQVINLETDWDVHHIIPKSKGGDNRSSNLMMLHINCHKQIHNPRFKG